MNVELYCENLFKCGFFENRLMLMGVFVESLCWKNRLPEGTVVEIIHKQFILQEPHRGNFCLVPYEQTKFYMDIGENLEFMIAYG